MHRAFTKPDAESPGAPQASETLGAVLERFVNKYGELAPECADVYMQVPPGSLHTCAARLQEAALTDTWPGKAAHASDEAACACALQYGLALLREVEEREENANDVFGDCVPREIATGEAPPAAAEAGGSAKEAAEGETKDPVEGEEGEAGGEEEGEEEGGEEGEEDGDGEGEEDGKAEGKEPAEDGEAPNAGAEGDASANEVTDDLQIAYEVLESARIIMEKEDDGTNEAKDKLADVYGYLGDVNLRNEQFDQSLADYTSCLKIREETCLKDDRLLMEVHHQIAMVYSLVGGQKESALEALRKAADSCEARLTNLKAMLAAEDEVAKAPAGSSLKPMSKADLEAEIIEVEEIAEEFRGRIESEELVDPRAAELAGGSSSTAAAGSSSASAGGLGGLDAVKLLAEQSGLTGPLAASGSKGFVVEGFAGVPANAQVKTVKVVSKKKKAEADATEARVMAEGKRPADDAGQGAQGAEKKAKPAVECGDASAAPTPARLDAEVAV